MPDWDRYGIRGDYPYVSGHWWDPYNRNKLKGDYPILGNRTFFVFTGVSDSLLEGRNLPVPAASAPSARSASGSSVAAASIVPVTSLRASFDRVPRRHGVQADRLARPRAPADQRQLREPVGVQPPSTRTSAQEHAPRSSRRLQEAFAEKKLFDIGSNYDFLSVRAGIQEFSTDFRGFMAVLEAPGIRVFGTLKSSRIEYNVAVFDLLEKDTNSGFNELHRRHQQIYVANVYIQDFLTQGYTQSFSFHYNDDRGKLHYDRNGFLVTPRAGRAHHGARRRGLTTRLGRQRPHRPLEHEPRVLPGDRPRELNPIEAQRSTSTRRWPLSSCRSTRTGCASKGRSSSPRATTIRSTTRRAGFDAIVDIPVVRGRPVQPVEPAGAPPGADRHRPQSPVSLLPTSPDEQG